MADRTSAVGVQGYKQETHFSECSEQDNGNTVPLKETGTTVCPCVERKQSAPAGRDTADLVNLTRISTAG